jgi:hypothetical protein
MYALDFAGLVRVEHAGIAAGLNDRCDWKKQSALVEKDYNNPLGFAQSWIRSKAQQHPGKLRPHLWR